MSSVKPKKNDWAVIYDGKHHNLVCFKNERDYYWGQTNSWATLTGEQEIVEFIGEVHQDNWDEMEVSFYTKYYSIPEEKVKESAGWLSPTGNFYPCRGWEHRWFSILLSAHYYHNVDNTELLLERKGWIRVYEDALLGYDYSKESFDLFTQEQRNTLFELSQVGSPEWRKRMLSNVEMY